MKQIEVTAYCDNRRLHEGVRIPAAGEHTLNLDGQARLVDLCDLCQGENGVLGTIASLISNGTPAEEDVTVRVAKGRRRRSGGDLPTLCPICGHDSVSRSGLGAHLNYNHNRRFKSFPGQLKHASDYEGLDFKP